MRPADIEMEEEGAPMAAVAVGGVPAVSPDRASALATFEATRVRRIGVKFLYSAAPAVPMHGQMDRVPRA